MLTRLKVKGFKNLVDVDVRFGAFTCIAGANGVGKSNLFDAIRFLSALADKPLMEAALSVRAEEGKNADIKSLFHRVGDKYDDRMEFEAEMIVPFEGVDDLGQNAKATITTVRYNLILAYRQDIRYQLQGRLEILKEELEPIPQRDATKNVIFNNKPAWRTSVIKGRRAAKFISTNYNDAQETIIYSHQDSGNKGHGQTQKRMANQLPRTVLSTVTSEHPTTLLTRREMQSWQLLQLEPTSLRQPDNFTATPKLGTDGAHLPATLFRVAGLYRKEPSFFNMEKNVLTSLANRLSELIDDAYDISIDEDDKREILTLIVRGKDGTPHPARSLSDGTLRFLALAVLELDPEMQGLICVEEPENGIHPERIPAIIKLLEDISCDVTEPIGKDNPLRQVIINTHSPSVVMQVPEDSLLVAELKEGIEDGVRYKKVTYSPLPSTWRTKNDNYSVNIGDLLSYLNPFDGNDYYQEINNLKPEKNIVKRVIDNKFIQAAFEFK